MPDYCLPKKVLFGWLPQPRPAGGPRKRWKNEIRRDVQARATGRGTCVEGLDNIPRQLPSTTQSQNQVHCKVCGKRFWREGDKQRHKCNEERSKLISEQRGSVHCSDCYHWFRSRGGLTVHRCSPQNLPQFPSQHRYSSVLMTATRQG